MQKYESSIINNYGDSEKVPQDCRTLLDICNRQGSTLLLDFVADYAGTNANRFKNTRSERARVVESLVEHFKNALNERV